jgi:hypothetical protein
VRRRLILDPDELRALNAALLKGLEIYVKQFRKDSNVRQEIYRQVHDRSRDR